MFTLLHKAKSHCLDYFCSLSMSSWRYMQAWRLLIILHILVSSANIYKDCFTTSRRSFINITNNTGPRTDPCICICIYYTAKTPFEYHAVIERCAG